MVKLKGIDRSAPPRVNPDRAPDFEAHSLKQFQKHRDLKGYIVAHVSLLRMPRWLADGAHTPTIIGPDNPTC